MMYFSPTGSISNLVERMCKGRDLRGVVIKNCHPGSWRLMSTCLLWLLPPVFLLASPPSHGSHHVPSTMLGSERMLYDTNTFPLSVKLLFSGKGSTEVK